MCDMELEKLRKEIDEIDTRIIGLLFERIKKVRSVAEYKKKNKILILDKKREKEILSSKKKIAGKIGIREKYVEDIFKRMIKESHNIENRIIRKKSIQQKD
jgi:chorismate mutase